MNWLGFFVCSFSYFNTLLMRQVSPFYVKHVPILVWVSRILLERAVHSNRFHCVPLSAQSRSLDRLAKPNRRLEFVSGVRVANAWRKLMASLSTIPRMVPVLTSIEITIHIPALPVPNAVAGVQDMTGRSGYRVSWCVMTPIKLTVP